MAATSGRSGEGPPGVGSGSPFSECSQAAEQRQLGVQAELGTGGLPMELYTPRKAEETQTHY